MHYALLALVLPKVKLEELFIVPVDKLTLEFLTKCRTLPPPSTTDRDHNDLPELKIIQDPLYRRLHSTVDMDLALKRYNIFR